ncbi:MAG: hypothetical protein P4L82_14095 [Ancalomicrobiaceae bacterium]|nr:hypothetical protein [Ancalomicrobiaceae bacterium]
MVGFACRHFFEPKMESSMPKPRPDDGGPDAEHNTNTKTACSEVEALVVPTSGPTAERLRALNDRLRRADVD